MSENGEELSGAWKKFLRGHWKMLVFWAIGAVFAAAWAVVVFIWFAGQAQSTGLVPSALSLWTMGYTITFLLNLLFWELVLVGIPVAVTAVIAYSLYKGLVPAEEREEYKKAGLFKSRSKGSDFGSGFSFLVNLGFVIKVYLDGNWNNPFANWSFDYLVSSYVVSLLVILAIFAVPALIGGTWWLRRELRS
jgi:hypothetical protein